MHRPGSGSLLLGPTLALALLAAPREVDACSCPQQLPPLAERLADSPVAFRGVVTELHDERGEVRATMEVREWWQGVTTPRVRVDFGTGGFTCTPGDFHQPGAELLVFARPQGELLVPPACVQPIPIYAVGRGRDELAALGPGKPPPPASEAPASESPASESGGQGLWLVLGAIAVVGTIGLGVAFGSRKGGGSDPR